MLGGAVINTVIGAGIKLGANMLNAWLEQKKQSQENLKTLYQS